MTGQRLSDEARAEIAARWVNFNRGNFRMPMLRYDADYYIEDVGALEQHAQWADERIRELEKGLEAAYEKLYDEREELERAEILSEPQPPATPSEDFHFFEKDDCLRPGDP